ncbi:uncharacterized protein [Rutidosis leptorrhynchoides]|uniref:uncharacterized protein n=1 Tax=Rutidosis leptorrhynchoides TaxID=125765 RepID=UPI003A9A390A
MTRAEHRERKRWQQQIFETDSGGGRAGELRMTRHGDNGEKKIAILFGEKEEPRLAPPETKLNTIGEGKPYYRQPHPETKMAETLKTMDKEEFKSKLEGWKVKFLSAAGKEVLIKSVLQSIPTYVMSLFYLPIGFCEDLEMYCDGGLGFKSLDAHNLALLTKQAWKLTTEPNTLLARIYKEKYFRISSFKNASLGSNPSAIWIALLEARDHRVIPPSQSFDPYLTVASLINSQDFSWKRDLVISLFQENQGRAILATPLITPTAKDRFIWLGTLSGKYTVQSGYHIARDFIMTRKNQRPAFSLFLHWMKLLKCYA